MSSHEGADEGKAAKGPVSSGSMQGYLLKKGGSRVVPELTFDISKMSWSSVSKLFGRRNWKRRYFVLDGDTGKLSYYRVWDRCALKVSARCLFLSHSVQRKHCPCLERNQRRLSFPVNCGDSDYRVVCAGDTQDALSAIICVFLRRDWT